MTTTTTRTTRGSTRPRPRPRRVGLSARLRPHAAGMRTPESMWLIGLGAVLLLLGLVMSFSASFVQSAARTGDAFGFFTRQAFWALFGIPMAIAAASIDYRRWRRIAPAALVVTLVLLALVLVIGEEVNGSRRWFQFGPLTMQPAEIAKLALPLYCAHVLAKRWDRLRRGDFIGLTLPVVPLTVVTAGLIAITPDLSVAVLVGVIGLTSLFVAGLPLRILASTLGAIVAYAVYAIQSTPYRAGRMAAWLDPTNEAFRDGYGYQVTQGFIALGNGGVTGVGLGQGRGKWLYVPDAHTDFIYAIIGEELGLIGGLLVLTAFALLAYWGCRVASRAPDVFGRLLAAGITAWLSLQAAVNISSVVGVLPVTGVTLPLVSYGGSSLVITMAGMGLLVAIARQATPDGRGLMEPALAADDRDLDE